MTVSGSYAEFNVGLIIEEAYERAGRELRSGYDLRTAIRSLDFLLADWASRGLNLWTIEENSFTAVVGQASYVLQDGVDEDESAVIDVIEAVVQLPGVNPTTDITLERLTVSNYAQIVNKDTQGRPIQFYCRRLEDQNQMFLWQVPDQPYTIKYWWLRRMYKAGGVTNTLDMPFRFIPALTAGLAYWVAVKTPEAANRVPYLKDQYDEAWENAAGEDRDRSSFFFYPDISWP